MILASFIAVRRWGFVYAIAEVLQVWPRVRIGPHIASLWQLIGVARSKLRWLPPSSALDLFPFQPTCLPTDSKHWGCFGCSVPLSSKWFHATILFWWINFLKIAITITFFNPYPTWFLGIVTVPGENLWLQLHRGIPRGINFAKSTLTFTFFNLSGILIVLILVRTVSFPTSNSAQLLISTFARFATEGPCPCVCVCVCVCVRVHACAYALNSSSGLNFMYSFFMVSLLHLEIILCLSKVFWSKMFGGSFCTCSWNLLLGGPS